MASTAAGPSRAEPTAARYPGDGSATKTGRSTTAITGATSARASRPSAAKTARLPGPPAIACRRAYGIPASSASGGGPMTGTKPET